MLKSSNPTLNKDVFLKTISNDSSDTMTVQGTVNKAALLVALVFFTALYIWSKVDEIYNTTLSFPSSYLWLGMIGGFIAAIISVFNKKIVKYTSFAYAVCQGMVLGSLSYMFEISYPGIATQALLGTFGVFFMMLFLYKSKIIKVTENFKLGVFAATGGIFFMYLISFILGFFGFNMSIIHGTSTFSILLSFGIVIIASLNLVMDFDFVEQGEKVGAPKYMEWYGAFALLVTLVWLYIEILRLLAKLRSRR